MSISIALWHEQEGASPMAEYDVRGQWSAHQSNGFQVEFNVNLEQADGQFAATASHSNGSVQGSGFGQVNGDQFTVTIGWTDGTKGAYIGVFNPQGVIHGATFDVSNPSSFAGWESLKAFVRA
jgi:hypothetical protein